MTIQFQRQYLDPNHQQLLRDALDYTKLYHTVKWERHNVDGNSKEIKLDVSEHISYRLQKTALLGQNRDIPEITVRVIQVIMLHQHLHQ